MYIRTICSERLPYYPQTETAGKDYPKDCAKCCYVKAVGRLFSDGCHLEIIILRLSLGDYDPVGVLGRLLSCGCSWKIIIMWLSLGDYYPVAVFGRLL